MTQERAPPTLAFLGMTRQFRTVLMAAAALAAAVLVFYGSQAAGLIDPDLAGFVSAVLQMFVQLLVAIAAGNAFHRAAGRYRWAWTCIGAASLGAALGIGLILVGAFLGSTALLDAPFVLFLVFLTNTLVIVALALMTPTSLARGSMGRLALDTFLIAGSIFLLLWLFAYRRVYIGSASEPLEASLSLIFAATTAAMFTLVALFATRAHFELQSPLRYLMASVVILGVTDTVGAWATLSGHRLANPIVDAGAVLSAICVALAALRSGRWANPPAARAPTSSLLDQTLPLLPVVAALTAATVDRVRPQGPDLLRDALAFALLVGLIGKLLIGVFENYRLATNIKHTSEFRSDLLRFVSHEASNPLGPIKVQVELLKTMIAPEWRQKAVSNFLVLDRSMRRLERLVNEVRDLALLDAGRFALDVRREDLAHHLAGALQAIAPVAEFKHIELTSPKPNGSVWIYADEVRLGQVLDNLLSNAVKYTPSGGRVTVDLVAVEGMAHLQVADTGKGLTPHQKQLLFGAFGRVDGQAARGMGLGLFISREIVHRHGGRIWANSEGVDRGSVFHVTFPLSPPTDGGPHPPSVPEPSVAPGAQGQV